MAGALLGRRHLCPLRPMVTPLPSFLPLSFIPSSLCLPSGPAPSCPGPSFRAPLRMTRTSQRVGCFISGGGFQGPGGERPSRQKRCAPLTLNPYLQRCKQVRPCWLSRKESACNTADLGSIPGSGGSPWRRKWQPSPVILPGKSQGQRSLEGYSLWGRSRTGWSD